jgi:hypothetical protein
MTIRVACTAVNKRISAGRVNKAGDSFIGNTVDVTSDCLKAVIDKIGVGNTLPITVDGVVVYEITITQLQGEKPLQFLKASLTC